MVPKGVGAGAADGEGKAAGRGSGSRGRKIAVRELACLVSNLFLSNPEADRKNRQSGERCTQSVTEDTTVRH